MAGEPKTVPAPNQSSPEWDQTVFDQIFELWITPEILRRRDAGELQIPLQLYRAQVLFRDDSPPIIRLNEEAQVTFLVRATRAVEAGEPALVSDFGGIEGVELDESDINAGHFTLVLVGDKWHLSFDLNRNKGRASELVRLADQFLKTAEFSLAQDFAGPYVDSLFSCCELLSKARLLTFTPEEQIKSHKAIHSQINNERKLGNVDTRFVELFNQLAAARKGARYDAQETMVKTQPSEAIEIARAEIDLLQKRFSRFEPPL